MAHEKNPTPQVGQVWSDNDERSAGAGEFTILEVNQTHVVVRRHATKRTSKIKLDRLAMTHKRGYRWLGASR